MILRIAFRNILRNGRRTTMTLLAIAVGGIAVVVFGAFIGFIKVAIETNAVRKVGHLTVFPAGYFQYGGGNPGAFGIRDFDSVIRLIQDDPEIKPRLNVITPTISLNGIAGNFEIDASKTFYGVGFIPSDRDRMQEWDFYHIRGPAVAKKESVLRDGEQARGVVGVGLARMLGLCQQLKIRDCPPRPKSDATAIPSADSVPGDVVALAEADRDPAQSSQPDLPRLDLLVATTSGAPNVTSLFVGAAEQQAVRELDDNYIAMPFVLAQSLLYGRGEHKAVGIVLQLHRTKDLGFVRERLNALFREHKLDLEVRDYNERQPFYKQSIDMLGMIFLFISLIMGVIVLFTVVNTMSMSVMERTNEIGTLRAMGDRRSNVRWLFLVEGSMLGALGGALGVVMGQLIAVMFNHAGLTWMPPGNAERAELLLMTSGRGGFLVGAWLALLIVATIAAVLPANRAARLKVVDALRHV